MALDPIQMQKMIKHAHDNMPTGNSNVCTEPMYAVFRETVRFLQSCAHDPSLLKEYLKEKSEATEAYNKGLGSWVDERTVELFEYYTQLTIIFCGPLEEMPLLLGEERPHINACATWRLENGR